MASAPVGQADCDPPSPLAAWKSASLTETKLTPEGIEGWALLWDRPPWKAGKEVKLVWRIGGSGDFTVVALGPNGAQVEPSWGFSF